MPSLLNLHLEKYPLVQRRLAAIIFGLVSLSALGLFFGNKLYECILIIGLQNCLFAALGTLSLLILSLILIKTSLVESIYSHAKVGQDYVLMLLTTSAWAGLVLADTLLVLMIAWYLFLYVINQWLVAQGLKWRIFVLRDDYENDGEGANL